MCLPNNNIVHIPFPDILDNSKDYDRKNSVRCKYSDKNECTIQRNKMAKLHNSTVRNCNFSHNGEKVIKIGTPSRCPSVPNFGNPKTISKDIDYVNISDIKNMLLYGLNDIIIASIWLQNANISNQQFTNLDIA